MHQPIGSRLHGALDYLTGASLIAGAWLPPVRGRFCGRAFTAAGAAHLAYSLVTDYELGVVRKLPYRLHLALDAAGAVGLAAAGATRSARVDRFAPIALGLYELGAVLLSDPNPARAARSRRRAVTVNRSDAEVRAFLSDPANVRAFSDGGRWRSFELRPAPGGRGTEIHARADAATLRRAKQLLEAGELTTAAGPSGRRGPLSALLPTLDTGRDAT
ncbi:MAG: hypothetical protein M3296_03280 [Actinomycetota bacterium]|nr:hypothetical protein [Actinomycetota bacterium]